MRTASFAVIALLASACVSDAPRPPVQTLPPFSSPPSLEAQATDARRQSAPRLEHRSLDVLVGDWRTRKVAVAADGTESDPHEGEAHIEWIFGQRFLQWHEKLTLSSSVYSQLALLGFDVNHAEYQLSTISDLTTGIGLAHGTGSISGPGIHLVLEVVDPRDGSIRRAQSTLRTLDRDHFVLDQIGLAPEGVERVVRRTHHLRASAPTK